MNYIALSLMIQVLKDVRATLYSISKSELAEELTNLIHKIEEECYPH